jgi:DNA replication protein DnaC
VKPMTEQAAEAAIRVACRELHLPTIAAEAPRIADDATRERLTHRGFLAEVLAAEVDERAQRRKARRLLEAHFPRMKRLEDFDTTVASGVPPATVAALQQGGFIDAGAPVVLLGDSGTGKSHLLIGMGWPPARPAGGSAMSPPQHWSTSWSRPPVSASSAAPWPATAPCDLLCLDELGYLHLDSRGAELLFQVLTEREEKASVAAASNAPFSEWGQTFTDPRLAAAIVDRLTFNALIIETGSQSYRLRATRSARKGAA